MSSIDQQFVEFIVKSLVSSPDSVAVERRIDEKGVLLELTVDPEDLGRVIGKRGATAQSLRTLLRALGTKNDARYNLKIVDNGVGGSSTTFSSDDEDESTSNSDREYETHSTVVSKTRKELEELDDLDV
ncbi:MAG TPA: KH domain-containing protein [Candidatus Saccharimonadales bacterium]|nr:KH domain-containing protein [Candidatus Saccharimonadales bacterium]